MAQHIVNGLRGSVLTSSGGSARGPPRSARDLYSSLPQSEALQPGGMPPAPLSPNGTPMEPARSQQAKAYGVGQEEESLFVDSGFFRIASAVVITLNTLVIALECQDLAGRQLPWLFLEAVFAVLYVLELFLRIYGHGCRGFFWPESPSTRGWHWFDCCITTFGIVDVIINQALNIKTNASAARLLRLLRILRVFRILRFLRDVEYVLVSSLGSVIRVIWLVVMIDFIGAVIITNLLHDSEDELILEMFGKLSSSMFFLFEVMVDGMAAMHTSHASEAPGGLVVITHYTMEIYPQMWTFWIAFVFIGPISLMALVPAIIVELNLRDAEILKDQQKRKAWELQVEKQRHVLEMVFDYVDQDRSNSVSWKEFDKFLSDPDGLKKIGLDDAALIMRHKGEETEDMEEEELKMDMAYLRMEFTRVYDQLHAQGREELSCEEFVEAFRHMRAKPMDQVVLTLQQEIFNLRMCMLGEHKNARDLLDEQGRRMEAQMSAIAQLNQRCAAVLAHAELRGFPRAAGK